MRMLIIQGTEGDPCPSFLSASQTSEEAEQYVHFFKEYLDIFAWSYAEMPRLDPKIAVRPLLSTTLKLTKWLRFLKHAFRLNSKSKLGLEYDLDPFNIVAIPDFNMGAMENKSFECSRSLFQSLPWHLLKLLQMQIMQQF
ncbi:hypothetical protein NE237_028911 [Protea cynaroides]|uniref:Uncharacterized protein n=1 Tax=Protea cynaroides TaxID=273540 RepID=A0A9Q0GR62_9MAGN|nr:hypothetical protein NE237_028911 [Protea cynaroides]